MTYIMKNWNGRAEILRERKYHSLLPSNALNLVRIFTVSLCKCTLAMAKRVCPERGVRR